MSRKLTQAQKETSERIFRREVRCLQAAFTADKRLPDSESRWLATRVTNIMALPDNRQHLAEWFASRLTPAISFDLWLRRPKCRWEIGISFHAATGAAVLQTAAFVTDDRGAWDAHHIRFDSGTWQALEALLRYLDYDVDTDLGLDIYDAG